MNWATYFLVITLLPYSSQSGKAVTAVPMLNEAACRTAAASYLASLPRDKDKPQFYSFSGPVSVVCLPSGVNSK